MMRKHNCTKAPNPEVGAAVLTGAGGGVEPLTGAVDQPQLAQTCRPDLRGAPIRLEHLGQFSTCMLNLPVVIQVK